MDRATEERLSVADAFLREAVYHARTGQAAAAALARLGAPKEPQGSQSPQGRGRCGLGEKAFHALDLSPRGEELLARLFPNEIDAVEIDAGEVARLRTVMHAWIDAQDTLDRKRNHFLKAFRLAHGSDRAVYSPEELAEYEAGLARINAEEDAARLEKARELTRC